MKRGAISRIAQAFGLTVLIAGFTVVVVPNHASAQGSREKVPCTVNYLRLRIATGGDDLRGWDGMSSSKDNLDVTVYFGEQGSQLAANINKNQRWQNNSVHLVEIKLNQAVPLEQIKGIKLEHTGAGLGISAAAATGLPGTGIQTADNWDMQSLEATAVGNGLGVEIARHGAKRFTGSDRTLSIRADIPSNSCSTSLLKPAARTVQKVSGTVSKYAKEQRAPSRIQPAPKADSQQLQNNRLVQQALAHTVQIGPRAGVPGGNASYSTIIAILKRQSAASHSLLVPAVKPPQIGAGQTMSTPGNSSGNATPAPSISSGTTGSFNLAPAAPANSLTPTNGPTAHRPPAGRQPPPLGTRAPMPTQICKTGIASVDGGVNGVWFSPVAGQDGQFVIQGCGFGNAPGEVYLSGVQYDPAHAKLMVQHLGVSNSPDRVYFQTPANGWSDRQIVAQIDANASGLYDTNNVTLNVKTASGQLYQVTGMNFLAAREDQVLKKLVRTNYPTGADSCYGLTLSECLVPGINLAIVNASPGPLTPQVESPTHYWLTPGESIAVVRGVIYLSATDDYSLTFPNGTDTYQFNLAPGFQLDPNKGVQLNHASMDVSHCQSLGGVYSHSGNWGVSYTSTSSFQVHWEEEACSPGSGAKSPQGIGTTSGYAGFSAYELEITVIGPRGINPLASGNGNGLAIKQLQPVQMLHKN